MTGSGIHEGGGAEGVGPVPGEETRRKGRGKKEEPEIIESGMLEHCWPQALLSVCIRPFPLRVTSPGTGPTPSAPPPSWIPIRFRSAFIGVHLRFHSPSGSAVPKIPIAVRQASTFGRSPADRH